MQLFHSREDFLDYISRGFDMRRAKAEYERKWDSHMRAIKRIVEEEGRDVNVPQRGYDDIPGSREIGGLLNDIRSGKTTPRGDFLEYTRSKGLLHHCSNLFVHLRQRYEGPPVPGESSEMPECGDDLHHEWISEFQRVHAIIRIRRK